MVSCRIFFRLKRGCRQGDPISPYIFILCVEILGKMIRNSRIGKEFKLSQYANDTQMFLDGTENSLNKRAKMALKRSLE